mmetsp:Transcript_46259/g.100575  ORF Transcript_46259/g.100575 Transcript_46259/m.100575 type:complete len:178 (-) Transcript_46259:95-628(-)
MGCGSGVQRRYAAGTVQLASVPDAAVAAVAVGSDAVQQRPEEAASSWSLGRAAAASAAPSEPAREPFPVAAARVRSEAVEAPASLGSAAVVAGHARAAEVLVPTRAACRPLSGQLPPLPRAGGRRGSRPDGQPSAVAQMVAAYWQQEEVEKMRRRGHATGGCSAKVHSDALELSDAV